MSQTRRIAAYGVCTDPSERLLLVRSSGRTPLPGLWQFPGGTVEHAEAPERAVVRELAEETGLRVAVTGLRTVLADVRGLPDGTVEHTDRIVYEVVSEPGELHPEVGGSSDFADWFEPTAVRRLPLMPFTAEVLGVPATAVPVAVPMSTAVPASARRTPEPTGQPRGRRFGAYGVVTDPAGRVLLSLIADGYPGAGRWHLPGGGTDHGEQPEAAVLREIAEESGQLGRVTALLDVSDHHNPQARGPEGHPIDWHVVRVLFRVIVDAPTTPTVTEAAGGSTARAAWFVPEQARLLQMTDLAIAGLRQLTVNSH